MTSFAHAIVNVVLSLIPVEGNNFTQLTIFAMLILHLLLLETGNETGWTRVLRRSQKATQRQLLFLLLDSCMLLKYKLKTFGVANMDSIQITGAQLNIVPTQSQFCSKYSLYRREKSNPVL